MNKWLILLGMILNIISAIYGLNMSISTDDPTWVVRWCLIVVIGHINTATLYLIYVIDEAKKQ